MMAKPQGIVIYDGPSLIDGHPIIAIATGWRRSGNPKTGPMIQTWIIRKDVNPCEAYTTGQDKSICGDCKHRKWGTCYVNTYQAPLNIYKAYHRGKYTKLSLENIHWFKGYNLRIGSYGDPVAIPFELWESLRKVAEGHSSYTHQWRTCDQRFKQICMASVDTEKEREKAKKMGWRTFRIRLKDDGLSKNEFACPASKEGGHKLVCDSCLLCNGSVTTAKKSPVIVAHGSCIKMRRYYGIMKKIVQKKKYSHLVPKSIRYKV